VQVKQSARWLLDRQLPAENAQAPAEKLSVGSWTHDFPFFAATARDSAFQ